ncbi:MAG: hypothetical protein K0Q77_1973 [Anaerosporomusa subterranea]|jgi:hypothetical protein|nr:hypothetical protein [Anaerosporomusa subterranea]
MWSNYSHPSFYTLDPRELYLSYYPGVLQTDWLSERPGLYCCIAITIIYVKTKPAIVPTKRGGK